MWSTSQIWRSNQRPDYSFFPPISLSPYIYFYFYLVLCLCFSILYFYSSTLNTFTNVNWPPATTLVETSCCSSLKWRNEPTMRWFMTGWDFKSLFLQLSKIAHIDRSTIALAFFSSSSSSCRWRWCFFGIALRHGEFCVLVLFFSFVLWKSMFN